MARFLSAMYQEAAFRRFIENWNIVLDWQATLKKPG
jgi:hypothetical protein